MSIAEFGNEIIKLKPSLKSFAFFLTKDDEDANDLLQETHFRALSNKEKFAEGTNIKAWLFTIMKNIFINNYRLKTRRKTSTDNTENQFYINSAQSVIGNKGESNITLHEILTAIDDLGGLYKKPFMMHYNGFKYQEISEEMGLPLGTVKSRIFFARKVLKKRLNDLV